jgi:hypothetical protein
VTKPRIATEQASHWIGCPTSLAQRGKLPICDVDWMVIILAINSKTSSRWLCTSRRSLSRTCEKASKTFYTPSQIYNEIYTSSTQSRQLHVCSARGICCYFCLSSSRPLAFAAAHLCPMRPTVWSRNNWTATVKHHPHWLGRSSRIPP